MPCKKPTKKNIITKTEKKKKPTSKKPNTKKK
jgi:hypothetical protein